MKSYLAFSLLILSNVFAFQGCKNVEWRSIPNVVNTIQILNSNNLISAEEMQVLNAWF
jgi:hypothetical protein